MKAKKCINIITLVAFLSILIVPIFFANYEENAISGTDNRELAASPLKAALAGTSLTNAIDSYLNDRVGFRSELIRLNSYLTYKVFSTSPVSSVILGKDGWLFYNGEEAHDGTPIAQYLGTALYTDEQLSMIASNLLATRDYIYSKGCPEFVLFIAPNKERIYSEYMPSTLQSARVSEWNNTDQLVAYLKENTDIRIVYPCDELMEYKANHPDELLYYRLDTHWNELGGYIGAKALLAELGIHIPNVDEENHIAIEGNTGDLYHMMGLDGLVAMNDISWVIPSYPDKNTQVNEEMDVGHWRYTNSEKDERTILVNRDSFTNAMRSILGSSFNEADLLHRNAYYPEVIDEDHPDVYVFELVERYDNDLFNPGLGVIP